MKFEKNSNKSMLLILPPFFLYRSTQDDSIDFSKKFIHVKNEFNFTKIDQILIFFTGKIRGLFNKD